MSELVVRGAATAEDVAVITAVLAARAATTPPEDAYRQWRRTRIAALRPDPTHDGRSQDRSTTG